MNWHSIFSRLKFYMLLIFAVAFMGEKFEWFKSFEALNEAILNDIISFAVVLYGVFYIGELRVVLKQKNQEITSLKTQLNG